MDERRVTNLLVVEDDEVDVMNVEAGAASRAVLEGEPDERSRMREKLQRVRGVEVVIERPRRSEGHGRPLPPRRQGDRISGCPDVDDGPHAPPTDAHVGRIVQNVTS